MGTNTGGESSAKHRLKAALGVVLVVPSSAVVVLAGPSPSAGAFTNAPQQGQVKLVALPAGDQPMLREGSRGQAVRDWQVMVNRLAADAKPRQGAIATDGVFGPMTRTATLAFQRWAGVAADGVVGPQTWDVANTTVSSAALSQDSHLKPLLHETSRGRAVQEWQTTLNKLAAEGRPRQAAVATDGVFGPITKAATMGFQRWAQIGVDGVVGVDTYTAASRALGQP